MADPGAEAGRRLIVGIPGPTLDEATRAHLAALRPAGVILFARNIRDPAQVVRLVAAVREVLGPDTLIAADQEGGVVVRFTAGATMFPGNMALGAAGDPALAEAQGRVTGGELARLGVTANFAPVCDLGDDPENPWIGLRAFGGDPARTGALAAALVRGHAAAGVAACAKHFPGLGAARVDPHLGLPRIGATVAELLARHWPPFAGAIAAGVPSIMTAHAIYPALDPDGTPAPFSRRAIHDPLRGELGFRGAIVSDDLEMGALAGAGGPGVAAVRAAAAGHDLLLVCHTPDAQRAAATALAAALRDGTLPKAAHVAALERATALRLRPAGGPPPPDGAALADAIAAAAVACTTDPAGRLPLAPGTHVDVLLPAGGDLTLVEGATGAPTDDVAVWTTALAAAGLAPRIHPVPRDPDTAAVAAAVAAVSGARVVLCATMDASRHAGQRALLAALGRAGAPLVVAHLRNPHDARHVPPGATQCHPWGFRPVHVRALAAALAGRAPFTRMAGPVP